MVPSGIVSFVTLEWGSWSGLESVAEGLSGRHGVQDLVESGEHVLVISQDRLKHSQTTELEIAYSHNSSESEFQGYTLECTRRVTYSNKKNAYLLKIIWPRIKQLLVGIKPTWGLIPSSPLQGTRLWRQSALHKGTTDATGRLNKELHQFVCVVYINNGLFHVTPSKLACITL